MLIGKVLWWDERKSCGVIKEENGDRYYFDASVFSGEKIAKIRPGIIVRFDVNESVKNALCAHRVSPATVREKSKHQRKQEEKRQLELFA